MPVLTEKQTSFLRALAQGAVPSEAYRIGFGHREMRPWMRQSAHVLMRSDKMAVFVEAARADYRRHLEAATEAAAAEQAAAHAALLAELGVSQERVIRALAAIAFADPTQFMSWDEEGNVTLRSSAEIGEAAAVVAADVSAGTGRLRMKLQDKLAALGMLARMLGLFEAGKERDVVDNSLNLSITIDGEEQGSEPV
jgi:phage terminase small subunit